MAIKLFKHQSDSVREIETSWSKGFTNVLSVLPTGAGKTFVKAEMARREVDNGGFAVIFAHRDVLLEQISLALCAFGLFHKFLTSAKTRKNICNRHVEEFGESFYDERSSIIVCSVDTFHRRDVSTLAPFITLWMLDEAHHLLSESKWNKCISMLPNARGLGVTATPIRADKKGLGRTTDGLFDYMITDDDVNATMHDLIHIGRLAPYKVYTPPSILDVSGINVTPGGDLNQKQLAVATDRKEITGDAVKHYRKLAHNKQTIIFTVNIAHSDHVAEQFRNAGYNAIAVSSNTPDSERTKAVKDFQAGRITILVNCDLFSEGFDVPGVECVVMLRKTESYSLFKQQFGRMLRMVEGKEFGLLIDHVGNVEYMMYKYELDYPHDDPEWSLDRPTKKRSNSGSGKRLVTRVCPDCFARYSPTHHSIHTCPECGHTETPDEIKNELKRFQESEGDLVELSLDVMTNLINQRLKVDKSTASLKCQLSNSPSIVINSAVALHTKRLNAQIVLRQHIQNWCMTQFKTFNNMDKEFVQREFELAFGIHPLKAAILSEREANQLRERIQNA